MPLFVQHINSKSQQDFLSTPGVSQIDCVSAWSCTLENLISHPYITLARYGLFIYFVRFVCRIIGIIFYQKLQTYCCLRSNYLVCICYFSTNITSSCEKYIVNTLFIPSLTL